MSIESQSSGRLIPIFQYRFGNGLAQAKAVIEHGIAGRPFLATVETFWRREADYYAAPWRGKWQTELGGVLIGQAVHAHDLLTFLMGPVKRAFGRTTTRVNDVEVDDTISASLEMRSGALASLSATLGAVDNTTRIRLAFENVTIESDHSPYNPGSAAWIIAPRNAQAGKRIEELLHGWVHVQDGFEAQLALVHTALVSSGPLPVTGADARAAIELATAIYFSSEHSLDVELPLPQNHPFYQGWSETAP